MAGVSLNLSAVSCRSEAGSLAAFGAGMNVYPLATVFSPEHCDHISLKTALAATRPAAETNKIGLPAQVQQRGETSFVLSRSPVR